MLLQFEATISEGVTEALSEEEVKQNLTRAIAQSYNVSEDEVEVELNYVAKGSMVIDIPKDQSLEEIEEALIDSIAEALDVHPKDISVTIDPESGEVEFEVRTGEDFVEAENIKDKLNDSEFIEKLENALSENLPESDGIEKDSLEIDDEISAEAIPVIDGLRVGIEVKIVGEVVGPAVIISTEIVFGSTTNPCLSNSATTSSFASFKFFASVASITIVASAEISSSISKLSFSIPSLVHS
jgi:hypothetical protein